MFKFNAKIKAFTIAEILITLSIIGIVASFTIPTVVANYQKHVYVIQLKKAYTSFNQALIQLANDYGCPGDLVCTGLFSSTFTVDEFGEAFVKYFKVSKNCKKAVGKGCWATYYNTYSGKDGFFVVADSYNVFYKFLTLDNMSVAIVPRSPGIYPNCPRRFGGADEHNAWSQTCAVELMVDVNGKQNPNRLGRDVFIFQITNGKGPQVMPDGGPGYPGWWKETTPYKCTPENLSGGNSTHCTGRIMEEGWQMNY